MLIKIEMDVSGSSSKGHDSLSPELVEYLAVVLQRFAVITAHIMVTIVSGVPCFRPITTQHSSCFTWTLTQLAALAAAIHSFVHCLPAWLPAAACWSGLVTASRWRPFIQRAACIFVPDRQTDRQTPAGWHTVAYYR